MVEVSTVVLQKFFLQSGLDFAAQVWCRCCGSYKNPGVHNPTLSGGKTVVGLYMINRIITY